MMPHQKKKKKCLEEICKNQDRTSCFVANRNKNPRDDEMMTFPGKETGF